MLVEKITALIGEVPVQFEPLMYVMAFIAFLWMIDGFMFILRTLVMR